MKVGQDKVEHWAFGFTLTFFGLIYEPLFVLGIVFAFAKEIYDYFHRRYYHIKDGFDEKDLAFTLNGAFCAGGILYVWILL